MFIKIAAYNLSDLFSNENKTTLQLLSSVNILMHILQFLKGCMTISLVLHIISCTIF